MASKNAEVPILYSLEKFFPDPPNFRDNNPYLPRLVDVDEFIETLKVDPEIEPGDISVLDMIGTVLFNYDKNQLVLKRFFNPEHRIVKFYRDNDSEDYHFYIIKTDSCIEERHF